MSTAIQATGVVGWVNRSGRMFGYIESNCGKEICFNEASLAPGEPFEVCIGEPVVFLIAKNEFGEMAFRMQRR
ncbi:hypothetical protein DSLASN_18660 [Desulfoluna limicola]|uniref:CSD domain-containing protein n=1 Tax=Desulfoluna limicola TaxID=2810562 RepID=A0ABN6F5D9_9BACT|nr:hypothetical protein [Desulfoluna limicola]BCS96234.1 hypothetical protein DSLASN_18660 [Desulfoluna limicola]